MIEVVAIDLGGVAAQFLPERRLKALSAASDLPEALVEERIFKSGFEAMAERGEYTSEQVFTFVESALEHRVARPVLIEAWSQAFEPNHDILELVTKIPRARALFTNNGPLMDACLQGPLAVIMGPFSRLVCSWHVNHTKPEPEAFSRAVGLLHARPAELLLLDDSEANVEAARRSGWDAELARSAEEMRAALVARDLLR